MHVTRRLSTIGLVATMGLALGAFPAGAQEDGSADASADASASATVSASASVPVDVSSASVGVRPTTVGPVHHDGEVAETPPIDAGTEFAVSVTVNATSSSDASADYDLNVGVEPADPDDAVTVERYTDVEGRECIGLGIAFDATVMVGGDTEAVATSTTTVTAQVDITLDGETVVARTTGDVVIDGSVSADGGPVQETVPVETGGDLCLPTVTAAPDADVDGEAEGNTLLDLLAP